MATLKILTVADKRQFLEQPSVEIPTTDLTSTDLQLFIDDLLETASTAVTSEGWRSAGLAAIQLGKPLRLFVVRAREEDAFEVFVNPKLEYLGEAKDVKLESCLSLPGVVGKVERYKRIRVTFLDRKGNVIRKQYDGFIGRAIQHEYDHLGGILFTSKVV